MLERIKFIAFECEHSGDVAQATAAAVRCGATNVELRRLDEDEEYAVLAADIPVGTKEEFVIRFAEEWS